MKRKIPLEGEVELEVEMGIVFNTIMSVLDGTAEAKLKGIGKVVLLDVECVKIVEGRKACLRFLWRKK